MTPRNPEPRPDARSDRARRRSAAARGGPVALVALSAALFGLGLAACGAESSAGTPEPARGLVVVEPSNPDRPQFHDFDVVRFGENVAHTFHIVNESPSPVTVRDVLPNCRCTVPRLTIEGDGKRIAGNHTGRGNVGVIPPGGSAELLVRIDSTSTGVSNNHKLAQVRLRCDSPETPYLNFELHLFVEKAFVVVPRPPVDLGRIAHSAGGEGHFEIVPSAAFPAARVLELVENPAGLQVELEQVSLIGTAFTRVSVKVLPFARPGRLREVLEFNVADGGAPDADASPGRVRVEVLATISEDLYTRPSVLELPRQAPADRLGASVELVSLLPGQRLRVDGSRLVGDRTDRLEVLLEPMDPDAAGRSARWTVGLRPRVDLDPGTFGGVLHLELDDPQYPRVSVPYRGWIDG